MFYENSPVVSDANRENRLVDIMTFWTCLSSFTIEGGLKVIQWHLISEVPFFESDTLLATLHPLLENVLRTICRKLREGRGAGVFDFEAPFSWLKMPRNRMGRDLDCMADVIMGFDPSRWAHSLPLSVAQRWRSTDVAPPSYKGFF
jgi:hypothetical protein